jgi:hypothetical protein
MLGTNGVDGKRTLVNATLNQQQKLHYWQNKVEIGLDNNNNALDYQVNSSTQYVLQ